MVRVLVIADEEAPNLTVQTLRDLSPDLVLSAGDLPWHYVEYVASCVDAPVVFVPGNHDPEIEQAKRNRRGLGRGGGEPARGRRKHHGERDQVSETSAPADHHELLQVNVHLCGR